jgi:hypothetical protein
MPRDWHELDEDELCESEEAEDEIPRGWQPSPETIWAIESEGKDVSEDLVAVQGFEKSGILRDEDVAEHLSTELPEEHSDVKRVREIEYTDKYIGDESTYVAGRCITDEHGASRIEINRQSSEGSHDAEEMKKTITHEVSHNVYYSLDEGQREEWNEINTHSAPDEFVSDYAQTNEREDFAESYMAYVHDAEYLKAISLAKYEFMRQYVFEGREY